MQKKLMHNGMCVKLFLVAVCCCVGFVAAAQKTELKLNAYSGLFSFRGNGSVSVTSISISGPNDMPGLYNPFPYGRESGFSYVAELQAQRVTRQNHLFGAALAFEQLQSKEAVTAVFTQMGIRPTTGTATFTGSFLTATPFVGQRFPIGMVSLDVQAGVDIAAAVQVREEANFTLDKNYIFGGIYKNPPVDIRPRLQLNAFYKRMGLLAGYSVGTTNYYSGPNYRYLQQSAYSNFLRFGLSYAFR